MVFRPFRYSWLFALLGVGAGCASGETDTSTGGGDAIIDGWVLGDGSGEANTDAGDSSVGDTGGDGADDAGSCDPEAGLMISCGVGECTVTIDACTEAGVSVTCKPKAPKPEVCDGKDNDCNGLIDDGLGDTTCGMGECKRTQKNCVDGVPKTCTAGTPTPEICNGKDDDCNGLVDDGLGTSTCGVGECSITTNNCEAGNPKTCMPKAPGMPICNGKDNDCDGKIDTDFGMTTCGVGECTRTTLNCVMGVPQTCVPGTPSFEICDGKDNDCNGLIDDGLPDSTCGIGECKNTIASCSMGKPTMCTPKSPTPEICDGKDNDCNGLIDDGLPILTCGIGECTNTVNSCIGGVTQMCTPKAGSPEICDGKDNDCNGVIDDGPPAVMCPPPAHTTTTACSVGKCKTAGCDVGWVDVNADFADGCECADSTTPHSCSAAKDLGTIAVGGMKTVPLTAAPIVGRDDWYKITFLDVKSNKLAHPSIGIATNPGAPASPTFVLEILPNSCSDAVAGCVVGGSEGPASGKVQWETSYTTGLFGNCGDNGGPPLSYAPTWQPILGVKAPGPAPVGGTISCNTATGDVNASVYFRVYYRSGAAATCSPYSITIYN